MFPLEPIAKVTCSRTVAEDDGWDDETSSIILDQTILGENAATGLSYFSHIEVVYVFDQVTPEKIVTDARHPRGNTDWPKVGILAQRGKNRPNRLGVTICRLLSVEGNEIKVAGLDAIDGTPVIDIKPVMSGFLPRGAVKEPDWAKEIMGSYWSSDS